MPHRHQRTGRRRSKGRGSARSPALFDLARREAPWNLTDAIRGVCRCLVDRLGELSHVDLSRVAVAFSQARAKTRHGLYASLTPMRFAGGSPTSRRQGRLWAVQRVCDPEGREMLYVLHVYYPRFMDVDFREKLATLLHELWHISPNFDGDLRRHSGRCYAHSHSQKDYDAAMFRLADRFLASSPPEETIGFLRLDSRQLAEQHGPIVGTRIPRPKLFPVEQKPAGYAGLNARYWPRPSP